MTKRIRVALRLAQGGIDAIRVVADRDGINWSEAARRLLAYSLTGPAPMPKGWHPGVM